MTTLRQVGRAATSTKAVDAAAGVVTSARERVVTQQSTRNADRVLGKASRVHHDNRVKQAVRRWNQEPSDGAHNPEAEEAPWTRYDTCSKFADALTDGETCSALENVKEGEYIGYAHWSFDPDVRDVKYTTVDEETWEAQFEVAVSYNPGGSSTTVCRPQWDTMSSDEQSCVDEYLRRAKDHECGHHNVVRWYAQGEGTVTLTARAASKEELVGEKDEKGKIVQTAEEWFENDFLERVGEADSRYEQITKNGRKQSALGGDDIVLDCP